MLYSEFTLLIISRKTLPPFKFSYLKPTQSIFQIHLQTSFFHLPATSPPNRISPPSNYKKIFVQQIFSVLVLTEGKHTVTAHTHTEGKKTISHFPLCIISQTCEMQNHCIHNGLDSFQSMVVWRERAEGDVLQIHSTSLRCVERVRREFINGIFNYSSSPPRHSLICRWNSTVSFYCTKLPPWFNSVNLLWHPEHLYLITVNNSSWQQGNPTGLQR